MAYAIRIEEHGGPEVLRWVEVDLAEPQAGEARIRTSAAGLNYIDTYHRSGLYGIDLPSGLGLEGVGIVEAVGSGVQGFSAGDRVGMFGPALGAYATHRNIPADQLIRIPDGIDDETAAALLLKGCTAQALIENCAKVEAGQSVLVYAASGGVGHIMTGWLDAIGASVIGVVGSEEKAQAARDNGAAHVIRHDEEDIAARVREITDGAGVPVIFDGVGKATWTASLDSASRRGLIVSYGNASGPVNDVALGTLAQKGSLFVTRPTLFDYVAGEGGRQKSADRLFAMVEQGAVKPEIGQRFALRDAAEAHRAIEASETQGATVLLP
ncbi:quinone oxidoreductase family protein [Stakelama pacifica]|uniref:NADPH2:quinone reductase n=1 Tax=Stakelama pacifica TaxID=517720 RepID=A0A4R6FCE3_9SPHN|nr:quinone oxidoreductase [Stakelama pacifica]TDN78783.1 NADPH2:quinone reductase [Stakelama pacifica]GGO99119.1 quinone oxidoreductase [Stakelama pacifica]